MKTLKPILILLIVFLPMQVFAQTPVQPPAYENRDSPVDLLASYYNAINLRDYARAYSYWGSPPLPYDQFSSGFAQTASAQLIVQPPTDVGVAAGSQYVSIPVVLIAQHFDRTTHTFAGCFTTRKSNLSPPDIPEEDVWHLYQADFEEVSNTANIPVLLAQACPVG
jgi:hypothetical protein